MNKLKILLEKYWGYTSFRPLQEEIILSVCSGKDTLALLPTGGGKSLTYQLPAMAMDGLCLVVTPLISLMKDQIDMLKKHNIRALCVHSGMTSQQIDTTMDNAVYGNYKFLYVSPERTQTMMFIERFSKMNISLIAIDEAHCIAQWGHDFRPNYLTLKSLRDIQPKVPILAVTASATNEVCDEIISNLKLKNCAVFKKSFARNNLSFLVRYTSDKEAHILKIIESVGGVGIVYCSLRKDCDRIAEFLRENEYSAASYHGGLGYQTRTDVQESWVKEEINIIVATNAFGMGVDKSNVRFVIHYTAPESIEAFYQEAGRAGRDGHPAFAVMLYNDTSRKSAKQHLASLFPAIPKIKEIYHQIYNYFNIGLGGGKGERHYFDIFDFCSKFKQFSAIVMSSVDILQRNNYMFFSEPSNNPPRIMFTISREDMYHIQIHERHLNEFIQMMMRLYSGVFSAFVKIDLAYIAKTGGFTLEYVNDCLIDLGKLRIMNYIPSKRIPIIFFNEERLDDNNIRIAPETYAVLKKTAAKRLEKMFEFIDRTDICRSIMIQNYFGEQDVAPCGKCDACRNGKNTISNEAKVIKILTGDKLDFNQIVSRTNITIKEAEHILNSLIKKGEVSQISGFYYTHNS